MPFGYVCLYLSKVVRTKRDDRSRRGNATHHASDNYAKGALAVSLSDRIAIIETNAAAIR
jgi:hypothetical protein